MKVILNSNSSKYLSFEISLSKNPRMLVFGECPVEALEVKESLIEIFRSSTPIKTLETRLNEKYNKFEVSIQLTEMPEKNTEFNTFVKVEIHRYFENNFRTKRNLMMERIDIHVQKGIKKVAHDSLIGYSEAFRQNLEEITNLLKEGLSPKEVATLFTKKNSLCQKVSVLESERPGYDSYRYKMFTRVENK